MTHSVCNVLAEFEGSNKLQTHLTAVTCILSAQAKPVFVWYNECAIPLSENLRFGLMQLREHLDTFLDRKDQANEVRMYNERRRKQTVVKERVFESLNDIRSVWKR